MLSVTEVAIEQHPIQLLYATENGLPNGRQYCLKHFLLLPALRGYRAQRKDVHCAHLGIRITAIRVPLQVLLLAQLRAVQ